MTAPKHPMFHREENDGFGMIVEKCSRADCDAQVVRPGKSQCRGESGSDGPCGDFNSQPDPLDILAARLDALEDQVMGQGLIAFQWTDESGHAPNPKPSTALDWQ